MICKEFFKENWLKGLILAIILYYLFFCILYIRSVSILFLNIINFFGPTPIQALGDPNNTFIFHSILLILFHFVLLISVFIVSLGCLGIVFFSSNKQKSGQLSVKYNSQIIEKKEFFEPTWVKVGLTIVLTFITTIVALILGTSFNSLFWSPEILLSLIKPGFDSWSSVGALPDPILELQAMLTATFPCWFVISYLSSCLITNILRKLKR